MAKRGQGLEHLVQWLRKYPAANENFWAIPLIIGLQARDDVLWSWVRRDAEIIWTHSLEEFVIALLRKKQLPARDRLLAAHKAYWEQLVLKYLHWRSENPDGDVGKWLEQASAPDMPSRGGSRQTGTRNPGSRSEEAKDVTSVLNALKKHLPSRYRSPAAIRKRDRKAGLQANLRGERGTTVSSDFVRRKQLMKAALQEALGTLNGIPPNKLEEWTCLTPKKIAQAVVAWKHGTTTTSLERYLPEASDPLLRRLLADRREQGLAILPGMKKFEQRLLRLRARVQDSQE